MADDEVLEMLGRFDASEQRDLELEAMVLTGHLAAKEKFTRAETRGAYAVILRILKRRDLQEVDGTE